MFGFAAFRFLAAAAENGAPTRTRTWDLLFRRELLCLSELWEQTGKLFVMGLSCKDNPPHSARENGTLTWYCATVARLSAGCSAFELSGRYKWRKAEVSHPNVLTDVDLLSGESQFACLVRLPFPGEKAEETVTAALINGARFTSARSAP